MRIELEHGQWAEFRDVEEIPNRDRKQIEALYHDESIPKSVIGMRLNHALLLWAVSGWSLTDPSGTPRPLPRDDPGVLDEIRARDYDLLQKAADNAFPRMFMDFKVDPDPNPPGGSSNGSGSVPAGTATSSTAASPTPTGSTSSPPGSAGP